MAYQPTIVDLSSVALPDAIETLDFEALLAAFVDRFATYWAEARAKDPTLPVWSIGTTETDPPRIAGRAFAYVRLLDRARVNDAIKAVLAAFARGADLDAIAASANVARLVVTPATDTAAAVMESDASLLLRYLAGFDRPSAGSRDRYVYEVLTAWPGLLDFGGDVAIVGRAVHGRRGDVDVVVSGPGGRAPTLAELATVTTAVTADHVKPEATSVVVLAATRALYDVDLVLEIPSGPSAETVRLDASARVEAALTARRLIGAALPADVASSAAYGENVIRVRRNAPTLDLEADAYTVPIADTVSIVVEVQS